MRCAEEFESILKEAKNVLGLAGDIDGPRHSKIPRRLDDSVIFSRLPAREEANISKMRQSYYETIDALILSLHERFNQKEFSIVKTMEDVLLSSVKGRNVSLSNLLSGHLDNELLEGQLNSLPTILGLYNTECKNKIKSVTHVSTLAEVFNAMPAAKIHCSEVHKMLKLYYTIPLTSANMREIIQHNAKVENLAKGQHRCKPFKRHHVCQHPEGTNGRFKHKSSSPRIFK